MLSHRGSPFVESSAAWVTEMINIGGQSRINVIIARLNEIKSTVSRRDAHKLISLTRRVFQTSPEQFPIRIKKQFIATQFMMPESSD